MGGGGVIKFVSSFVGKGGGVHVGVMVICGGGGDPGVRGELATMVRGLRKIGLVYNSLHAWCFKVKLEQADGTFMSSKFLVKFRFENDVTMKRAQKHVATEFGTCWNVRS